MERILIAAILALSALVASSATTAADYGPNIEGRAVRRVQPGYPALAKRHGVEGRVVVRVEVAADGTVARVTFLEGHALFKSASVAAAKQWVFGPASEPTSGHIVFTFTRPAD
jgi:periplasmic protein TonB